LQKGSTSGFALFWKQIKGLTMRCSFKKRFEEIRQLYFPRWDPKREWKLQIHTRRLVDGICEWDKKKIVINMRTDLVLIHEISHAVCRPGHGQMWLRRMETAAKRADELGEKALAAEIRKEVKVYSETPRLSIKQVYAIMEDAVLEVSTPLTFKVAVTHLGSHFGMQYKETLAAYPKLRTVYDRAIREWQKAEALRAKWEQAIRAEKDK
jgi:predicted Zn-dependent protease with MMP-like domain